MKEKKKRSLLLKLVIAIVLGIVVGFVTPGMGAFGEVIIRIGATYNSIFGNFLNFVIPLIIIGFVAPGIADLGAGAGKPLAATTGVAVPPSSPVLWPSLWLPCCIPTWSTLACSWRTPPTLRRLCSPATSPLRCPPSWAL